MTSIRGAVCGLVLVFGVSGCGTAVVGAAGLDPQAPAVVASTAEPSDPTSPTKTSPPKTSPPPTSPIDETSPDSDEAPEASSAEPTGPEVDREVLIAAMVAGYADVTSMSTSGRTVGGGLEMDMAVSQEMSDGTLSAMDMTMDMSVAGNSISMHLVTVDDRFYMNGPLAEQYAGGKEYLELTDGSGRPEIQELYDLFVESMNQTSATAHRNLLGAMKHIVDAGEEIVDGVPARRYDAVVDVAEFMELFKTSSGAAQMDAFLALGITEYPMTFWFDEQGRVLQVEQVMTVMGQTITTTSENAAFNEPVDIVAPDPEDVGQG